MSFLGSLNGLGLGNALYTGMNTGMQLGTNIANYENNRILDSYNLTNSIAKSLEQRTGSERDTIGNVAQAADYWYMANQPPMDRVRNTQFAEMQTAQMGNAANANVVNTALANSIYNNPYGTVPQNVDTATNSLIARLLQQNPAALTTEFGRSLNTNNGNPSAALQQLINGGMYGQ